jgi:hypothetical protein
VEHGLESTPWRCFASRQNSSGLFRVARCLFILSAPRSLVAGAEQVTVVQFVGGGQSGIKVSNCLLDKGSLFLMRHCRS